MADGDAPVRVGAATDVRFTESLESFAAFLVDLGLSHVELRHGYLDVRPDAPDPDRLRAVADDYDLTYSVHAPFRDAAVENLNEGLRRAAVEAVERSIDLAAAIDAGAVVVHGGAARKRYPGHVHEHSRAQAVRSIRACARYAAEREVPLCLENGPETDEKRRFTATPDRLGAFLDDVAVDSPYFRVTLDVGHAKASGVDYRDFVDRFGDRIHHVHLHDNDGTADDHDPMTTYGAVAAEIGAPHNVLEMKSLADIERCVEGRAGE